MSNYASRKPGTNPRTGEPLVPSSEVQVTPVTDPLDTKRIGVAVKTDVGERIQMFRVRVPKGCSATEERLAAVLTAKRFGFTTVLK